MRKIVLLALVFIGCLAVGCSSTSSNASDATVDNGNCTTAFQCPKGEFCYLATNMCTTQGQCTTSADCGVGGYCSSGQCRRSTTGNPCTTEAECPSGEQCVGGLSGDLAGGFCGCEGQQFVGESVPPNILLTLDRSQSMLFNLHADYLPNTVPDPANYNFNPPIRWDSAEPAVNTLMSSFENKARFGLVMYPTGGNCNVHDTALVEPGLGKASSVMQAMAANSPQNVVHGTPMLVALRKVRDGLVFTSDPSRDNFVVVVTDGVPTCPENNEPQNEHRAKILAVVTELANQTPAVHTYVIGFGGGNIDDAFLDDVAAAGQTDQAFSTADESSLFSAFDSLFRQSLSCDYKVDPSLPVEDLVVVVGDDPIREDLENGWTHNSADNTIEFHGLACEALKAGAVDAVTVLTDCPAAPL